MKRIRFARWVEYHLTNHTPGDKVKHDGRKLLRANRKLCTTLHLDLRAIKARFPEMLPEENRTICALQGMANFLRPKPMQPKLRINLLRR